MKSKASKNILRVSRSIVAALFLVAITLLFTGLSEFTHPWTGWMAKIQFLPALMAMNVGVLVGLAVLTLVFGRIYCSVICPLGVFQDVISRISSMRKGKKMRFRFSPERKWLRYTVWVLFVAALVGGVHAFVALLAPYSAYGRIVQSAFGTGLRAWPTVAAAAVTLIVTGILAWIGGRTYCNTICPVGTTLGFLSRFSLLRPLIDTSKCKMCHACERKCKSSCIDLSTSEIDYSRCVTCFDCIDSCRFGAMKYGFAYGKSSAAPASPRSEDSAATNSGSPAPAHSEAIPPASDSAVSGSSRRAFLASSVMAATAAVLKAQEKKLDGGLAPIKDKIVPDRTHHITPFGSKGIQHMQSKCTACQLCVAVCPNSVLRPSTSPERLMQPEMSFEKGYCRPECTKCSQVCPSGAILPITPEEKTSIHVGTATVNLDLCVVNRDGVSCGNCARHCPVGAIMMVRKNPEDKDSLRIPTVNEQRCIGCGACENLCPSRPLSAIHVNGLQVHIHE